MAPFTAAHFKTTHARALACAPTCTRCSFVEEVAHHPTAHHRYDVYQGYERHGLMAIVAERNPQSESALGVDYYGVAVVRKSFCDERGGSPTLADLKGKRACSTGGRVSWYVCAVVACKCMV
jgi:hypothetical protein